MKKPDVSLVFAQSVDGFYQTNRGDFTPSAEDQTQFAALLAAADATLMGRKTAEQNINRIRSGLRPGLLRLGLTHHPELFSEYEVAGMLEFKNMPASEAVDYLIALGKQRILVLSGGMANDLLRGDQLTSAYLTVEPVLLHQGLKLAGWEQKQKKLRTGYPKKLNDRNGIGTKLFVYDL